MWIDRYLAENIVKKSTSRPVIYVGGARQSGKSSLLKHLFPNANYVSFDDFDLASEASSSPTRFLEKYKAPIILDEIQYVPELFRELKVLIDEKRHIYGQYFLTGSQQFDLMKGVKESLAGRIGITHLETLGLGELKSSGLFNPTQLEDILWKGGYPQLWSELQINIKDFFNDYIQTYLTRDLQSIIGVTLLRDFRRFMALCAARVGCLIEYADISKDLGVSAVTIKAWLSALEASGIIYLLPPYFENMGKRLVKAPKLYFADQGILCNLLRIQNKENFFDYINAGNLWENFVFTELVKTQRLDPHSDIFFYRDQNGVEIDFLVLVGNHIHLIEAKSSERPEEKKLNFSKVTKLFEKNVHKTCWVACPNDSPHPIELKTYNIFNPLHHKINLLT